MELPDMDTSNEKDKRKTGQKFYNENMIVEKLVSHKLRNRVRAYVCVCVASSSRLLYSPLISFVIVINHWLVFSFVLWIAGHADGTKNENAKNIESKHNMQQPKTKRHTNVLVHRPMRKHYSNRLRRHRLVVVWVWVCDNIRHTFVFLNFATAAPVLTLSSDYMFVEDTLIAEQKDVHRIRSSTSLYWIFVIQLGFGKSAWPVCVRVHMARTIYYTTSTNVTMKADSIPIFLPLSLSLCPYCFMEMMTINDLQSFLLLFFCFLVSSVASFSLFYFSFIFIISSRSFGFVSRSNFPHKCRLGHRRICGLNKNPRHLFN